MFESYCYVVRACEAVCGQNFIFLVEKRFAPAVI